RLALEQHLLPQSPMIRLGKFVVAMTTRAAEQDTAVFRAADRQSYAAMIHLLRIFAKQKK
ncbi:MAG: hypothetical protein Q7S89_00990, partial [bacterium]|nr:hypothetical protein [bacterium]